MPMAQAFAPRSPRVQGPSAVKENDKSLPTTPPPAQTPAPPRLRQGGIRASSLREARGGGASALSHFVRKCPIRDGGVVSDTSLLGIRRLYFGHAMHDRM